MAKKELCFVIMPFHKDFDNLWKAIQRAGKRFKYLNIERSNTQDPGNKKVFQNITEAIKRASFVIADISDDPKYSQQKNPNVMLEAGYAMGFDKDLYLIARQPLNIPSDLNQHSVMEYDPKNKQLKEWFEIKIEKMMLANQIDTQKLIQRKETKAEKLNWLIEVVQRVRTIAKDNYERELWEVGGTYFSSDSYTFAMRYQNGARKYEIRSGVFFSKWKRRDTPFRIFVKKFEKNKFSEEQEFKVELEKSMETISIEKVLDKFEEKLDQILLQINPKVSTLTPLAHILQVMEDVKNELNNLQVEGFTSLKSSNLSKTKRTVWSKDGFKVEGFLDIDNSVVELSIDFTQWEDGAYSTPYWVRFRNSSSYVKDWFKEIDEDGTAWLIPILVKNKHNKDEIINKFKSVIKTLIEKHQPKVEQKTTN